MLGAISGYSAHSAYIWDSYRTSALTPAQRMQLAQQTDAAANTRPAAPEYPVQPVRSVAPTASNPSAASEEALLLFGENDPSAMAVRMRIQYPNNTDEATQPLLNDDDTVKSPYEIMDEDTCQTCEERKYQDGSDDPGVSFKTPAHIDSSIAASVVRGHEMEHVVREQASAQREGREVVSQTVTLHNSICPECGKVYVSGGTTRTVTAAARGYESYEPQGGQDKPAFAATA